MCILIYTYNLDYMFICFLLDIVTIVIEYEDVLDMIMLMIFW